MLGYGREGRKAGCILYLFFLNINLRIVIRCVTSDPPPPPPPQRHHDASCDKIDLSILIGR